MAPPPAELTINSQVRQETYQQQRKSLVLLVGFRMVIVSALLISTIVSHVTAQSVLEQQPLISLYTVAASFFLANLIYSLLFKVKAPFMVQVVSQIFGDLLFAAVILHLTGGVQSAFSFFYLLTAINGSILLKRRESMIVASVAVICYLTQIALQFYGILTPYRLANIGTPPPISFLNASLMHTFAIYAVCFLSMTLAEQAQKAHNVAIEIRHDLSHLKELHLSVLQNLPVGVVTLDSQGIVVLINSLAAPLLGNQVAVGAKLQELFSHPLLSYSEGMVVQNSGNEMALLVRFTPLKHNDELLGNIITLQDVSLVQKMERELHQKAHLAAIGELAAGMAHEIRNPLASIRGSVEMLSLRTAKDNAEQRLMSIAIREIDRLNQLISDFLNYSRPQKLTIGLLDFKQLCVETIDLLASNLPGNIKITMDACDVPLVEGDHDKLRQVIWNLLKNAIDACQSGSKTQYHIVVELMGLDDYLQVKIIDDGSGIAPENIKNLFMPFFSTKSKGNGLGLSIVQRIIEGHQGSIDVSSILGESTTFTITLPLRQTFNTINEEA